MVGDIARLTDVKCVLVFEDMKIIFPLVLKCE